MTLWKHRLDTVALVYRAASGSIIAILVDMVNILIMSYLVVFCFFSGRYL